MTFALEQLNSILQGISVYWNPINTLIIYSLHLKHLTGCRIGLGFFSNYLFRRNLMCVYCGLLGKKYFCNGGMVKNLQYNGSHQPGVSWSEYYFDWLKIMKNQYLEHQTLGWWEDRSIDPVYHMEDCRMFTFHNSTVVALKLHNSLEQKNSQAVCKLGVHRKRDHGYKWPIWGMKSRDSLQGKQQKTKAGSASS